MDRRTTRTAKAGTPYQEFNGKKYFLYSGEAYFSAHEKRLHVAVWEYHNGRVPEGYHIHHKDQDKHNNHISNLELMEGRKHRKLHANEESHWLNTEEGKQHIKKNQLLAKAWHKSEEGLAWHREHAKKQGFGSYEYGEAECIQCKAVFRKKAANAKFCKPYCSTKFRKASGVDDENRTCIGCGIEFTSNKYARKVYCSISCSKKKKES